MSLEPAFLAAIAAAPDDDLPRLVYADWLDENGRPLRAEFIRLQIEIAHKETLPRAALNLFTHLWQRQNQILTEHSMYELVGEPLIHTGVTNSHFRRGFVSDITFTAADYLTDGAVAASLVPLPERIRVIKAGGVDDRFFRGEVPGLNVITDLSLLGEGIELPNAVGFVMNFYQDERWARLSSLDLEGCRLGDLPTELLFSVVRCFPALEDLDLSFNDLTDAGVVALLGTGVPQRLKRLVLGGNPIGDDGAIALAEALANSPVLENLNLRMTNIGTAGRAALLAALGGKVDLF